MEWMEVNCLLEALDALVDKYQASLGDAALSDDDRADTTNDLAFAEVLRGKYRALHDELAKR